MNELKELYIVTITEGIFENNMTYDFVIVGEDNAKRMFAERTSDAPLDDDGMASLFYAEVDSNGVIVPTGDPIIDLMWDGEAWRDSDEVIAGYRHADDDDNDEEEVVFDE